MSLISITNLARNTVSILFLLAMLLNQTDESKGNSFMGQQDLSGQSEDESFKKRIHLGFSKYGKVRLQQTINDTRQL